MLKIKFFCFFIGIILLSSDLFGQTGSVIVFDSGNEIQTIGKQAYFLEDKDHSLTLESILKSENQAKFQKSESEVLNFGNLPSTFWLKLQINSKDISGAYLEVGNPMLDHVSFFYPSENGSYQERQAGASFPVSSKEIKLNTILFSLDQNQATDSVYTCYLKIRSNFPLEIPLSAGKLSKLTERQSSKDSIYSFYMGLMYIMALYNLFIFILVKDRVYIIYSLFIFTIGSFYLHLKGYMFYFFFSEMPFLNFYTPTFASLVPVFMLLFASDFLNSKKYTPNFHKGLYVFMALFAVSALLNLSGDYLVSAPISQAGALFLSLYLFVMAVKIGIKGNPMAKFYLFAWALYLGSVVIFLLHINSVVPTNMFTSNSVFIGTGIEVWFFSFALAYRINLLKKEKDEAQAENISLIKEQNEVLAQKVTEKTVDLQTAYEEIQVSNEELMQQQEEILSQRDLLENKNDLLQNFTHKIGKSIEAAKRIQKAILPSKTKMKELFKDCFVIFKPKDVVSGDFWWANQIENRKYLIVADCTGHGVSGGMLTMIGASLLDRIILVLGITEPSAILEKLHSEIQTVLQQEHSKNTEGMDIAVIRWHDENDECFLSFSAAKRPLWFTSNGKIEKLTGSRKTIGGFWNSDKIFETQSLRLPKNTCLYLASDGYADQNDAERNRFSEKKLLRILEELQDLPMEVQKTKLKNELEIHMKDTELRDDILIVGVRV